MEVSITYQKNPAMAWDITVVVKADAGEAIAGVDILVNGFSKFNEGFNPLVNQWQKTLVQQGQWPGDNKAEARALDANGKQTSAVNEWS